jgi:uncharacterized membrane protein YdjX (TVP38/TMEM64 family)
MNPGTRRTLLLSLTAAGAAALGLLLISQVMTFADLKEHREELLATIARQPVAFTTLFMLAFAVLAAAAPGAAVLKVAAGALYGLWGGFLVSLFSTLMAATIGFVAARYLLRGWVERRFRERITAINRGVEQDGVVFLLALRFNPLVPFFLINFGMGMTRMRLWVFVVTSFFGLIPASIVYSNAGTQLASIDTPADIVSVRLLGSLLLLSLMPLAGRWAAKRLRKRQGRGRGPAAIAPLPGED